jgi:sortase A
MGGVVSTAGEVIHARDRWSEPGDRAPSRFRASLRSGARVGGELLVTAGLVVAMFVVYQIWITDVFQARTQDRLRRELARTWAAPAAVPTPPPVADAAPPPAASAPARTPPATTPPPRTPAAGAGAQTGLGRGMAVLHIPRFGADYAPVVVEGVSVADLKLGPGHYPGTALPGQVGNFVVSGHRTTYGGPFGRLDELRPGDPIVVEIRNSYFTYLVTRSKVVAPNRTDVVLPVPEKFGVVPTKSALTFTTCHPRYSAASRLVVFAELGETTPKSAGRPAALAGG